MSDLIVKGISNVEKKIMIHSIMAVGNKYIVCTEKGKSTITMDEYKNYKMNPRSSDYMLVNHDETNTKTLITEYYDQFIKMADELKHASGGRINLYKTGRLSNTTLSLLYSFINETNIRPEVIESYENRFLKDCGGAFRLGIKYEGPLYKYDYISYYTSIYKSKYLLIPIKKGILKTITQTDFDNMKFVEFGVYHCKIDELTGDNKKLIWINKTNYYTHYELSYILSKGVEIKIIEEPDNFLSYPRDYCKAASEIFGDYAKYVFPLKRDKIKGAKLLLNSLWGIICKQNCQKLIHDDREPDNFELKKGWTVSNTTVIDDHRVRVYIQNDKVLYENPLARMKPFFLAKCRITMAKTIEPYIKDVYYCHTDSIVSSIPLPFKPCKGECGDILYEGYCEDGYVINSNQKSPNSNFIE